MCVKTSFLHDNQVPHPKSVLLYPHQCETSKSPDILGCLVFSLRCFAAHTPSHVSSEVFTFMYPLAATCQRCGPLVLHALQPWRKSLRKSLVMHLFERSTVWCSLLVVKISYSAPADTHKSWPSWLWRHNTSPPPPFWRPLRWFFVVPLFTFLLNFCHTNPLISPFKICLRFSIIISLTIKTFSFIIFFLLHPWLGVGWSAFNIY